MLLNIFLIKQLKMPFRTNKVIYCQNYVYYKYKIIIKTSNYSFGHQFSLIFYIFELN